MLAQTFKFIVLLVMTHVFHLLCFDFCPRVPHPFCFLLQTPRRTYLPGRSPVALLLYTHAYSPSHSSLVSAFRYTHTGSHPPYTHPHSSIPNFSQSLNQTPHHKYPSTTLTLLLEPLFVLTGFNASCLFWSSCSSRPWSVSCTCFSWTPFMYFFIVSWLWSELCVRFVLDLAL